MQALKQDIKQASHDVSKSIKANGAESVTNLRDTLVPLMQSAKDSMNALGDGVRTRAVDAAHKTDEYAHTNPWRVAGVSAALGLTLGFLFARRF
jgi:ElaB/YqjD/DUF883 family membrane-anchored ribosome-binding protein